MNLVLDDVKEAMRGMFALVPTNPLLDPLRNMVANGVIQMTRVTKQPAPWALLWLVAH